MTVDELIEKYGLEAYFYEVEENPHMMGGTSGMYNYEYSLYDYEGAELNGYYSVGSMLGSPDIYMLLETLKSDMEIYHEADYESLGYSVEEGERLHDILDETEEELLNNLGSDFYYDLLSVDFDM